MNVEEALIELASAEKDLVRAKKALNEIPEAAKIVECRAKRKELKGKQDQVVELTDEVNAKLAAFEEEETKLIAKMNELQDTLDHTSDYRVTTSVTRDMQGLVKRQSTIAEETDTLLERQIKIDHLAEQVADMLAKLDHKEHHLTEDFKVKGGEAKREIDAIEARVAELLSVLPADLAARYAKLKDEKGGMPVAVLEGSHCSVCRSEFPTGQMSKLKSGPTVTECPNCHRIFVMVPQGE